MKARLEKNGSVKIYTSLPRSWGKYLIGFDLMSDEVHQEYGFYPVVIPDYNPRIQQRSTQPVFDAENKVFTFTITDVEVDIEQLRAELKEKHRSDAEAQHAALNAQDWKDIRVIGSVSPEQKAKHEAITATYRETCSLIDACKTIAELLSYE